MASSSSRWPACVHEFRGDGRRVGPGPRTRTGRGPVGAAVRGGGRAEPSGRLFWGVCVGRVGLLWRLGAGLCPNLPQRRPEPGSAVRRSAEYQRFSSGVPARLGPLWQIWTIRRLRPAGRGGRRSGGGPAPAPMTPPGPRERSLGRISAPGPVRGLAHPRAPPGRPRFFANAQVSSRTRTSHLRVRLETYAFAKDDGSGAGESTAERALPADLTPDHSRRGRLGAPGRPRNNLPATPFHPPLRPFTLRYAPFSRTAEGEEA